MRLYLLKMRAEYGFGLIYAKALELGGMCFWDKMYLLAETFRSAINKVLINLTIYNNVTLKEVFFGPSMAFTNLYNPRSLIERKDQYRDTAIKRGATIINHCNIIFGVIVDCFVFIGAGFLVHKNGEASASKHGIPA